MSQSLLYHAFGVREGYKYVRTEYHAGAVQFHLAVKADQFVCPECRSRDVIRKGKRTRRVQTLPIGFHPIYLEVGVPRCQCNSCRHIFEIAPPFAQLTRTTPKR